MGFNGDNSTDPCVTKIERPAHFWALFMTSFRNVPNTAKLISAGMTVLSTIPLSYGIGAFMGSYILFGILSFFSAGLGFGAAYSLMFGQKELAPRLMVSLGVVLMFSFIPIAVLLPLTALNTAWVSLFIFLCGGACTIATLESSFLREYCLFFWGEETGNPFVPTDTDDRYVWKNKK